MRVRVNPTGATGTGGVLVPGDPPPPQGNINDIFRLELFQSSATAYRPFDELAVEWRISPVGGNVPPDYRFLLVANYRTLDNDLALSGAGRVQMFGETSLAIRGAPRGTSFWQTLGESIPLSVDTSECTVLEASRALIDGMVTDEVSSLTGETASIVLRGDVSVTWGSEFVSYSLPFRIDIPSFFNANLDIELRVYFRVFHEGDESELDITIEHTSNVVFSNVEHIGSFGHAATVEATAEALIPLLLDCVCRSAEAQAIRSILQLIAVLVPSSYRLFSISIVPLDDQSRVELVLCPE
jgi:hypothetical protein